MKRNLRSLSLLLILTIVFSSFSVAFADEEQDKTENIASDWALEYLMEAEIQELAEEAYFTQFRAGVTRAELANFIVTLYARLSGEESPSIAQNPFKDTEDEGVLKALALELISIKGDEFLPEEKVKREDVAVAIYDVIEKCEPGILGNSKDKVEAIVSNGILKGKSSNNLGLDDICTREEVLSLFARAYDFVIHKTDRAAKGFMWEVSNDKNSIYVLGSIHMADSSIYPFSERILGSFDKSDILALEADILGDQEGLQYMMEKAMYYDDNTLEKDVSPETYKAFVEKISAAGLDPKEFEKIKPWYAAILVQNLSMQDALIDATKGIDFNLALRAIFKDKDIVGIEGIKFQADMFDSMSKELQVNYLESVLFQVKDTDVNIQGEIVKSMLDMWKKGDMVEFEKLMEELNAQGDQEFNNMLFDKRNKNMADKVEEYLNSEDGQTYFVVVGAGHLIGDTGIIKAMKDRGYEVRQIK